MLSFVTSQAARGGMSCLVAVNAPSHRCNVGSSGQNIHGEYRTMAGFAFHTGIPVGSVTPKDPVGNLCYSNPWNVAFLLGKARQFLYIGIVLCNCNVAEHALSCGRQRHCFAGIRIRMTLGAL